MWSTGGINQSSKGLIRKDTDNLIMAVVPFNVSGNNLGELSASLLESLQRELNTKDWLDYYQKIRGMMISRWSG